MGCKNDVVFAILTVVHGYHIVKLFNYHEIL
jgi:hypothetical protein